MQVILDTNTLVRFFTRDIETKAQLVKKLLESDRKLYIPDVVFPELEYILTKQYKADREKVCVYFRFLISRENVKTSKEAETAVETYENTKLDMADCIITTASFKGSLASFDKELLQVENVTPFWE